MSARICRGALVASVASVKQSRGVVAHRITYGAQRKTPLLPVKLRHLGRSRHDHGEQGAR
jgi:hypothetical protein